MPVLHFSTYQQNLKCYVLLQMKNIHVIHVGKTGLTHILYKWWNQLFNICLKAFFSLKCSCYLSQSTYSTLDSLWGSEEGSALCCTVCRYEFQSSC